MHKLLALLIVGAVLVAAVEPPKKDEKLPEKKPEQVDQAKKRMAAVGPKDLDIKRIAGHWLQVAGSAALHKSFLQGCGCNQVDFKQLSDIKLAMIASCKNQKDNKLNSVNGTLTMVKPNENKSLFRLEFTEVKGNVKGVEVNKTEAREVKKIEGGGGAANATAATQAKGGANATATQAKATDVKGKAEDANVIILKVGDNYESLAMGSPALDSAWILARKPLDDKKFEEYSKFLENQGFSSSKLIKIPHDKCGDIQKEKGK